VWVLTDVRSLIVGGWTLGWLIALSVSNNGLAQHLLRRAFRGPGSSSSRVIDRTKLTGTLTAHPIPSIYGVRRWRLTCVWGTFQHPSRRDPSGSGSEHDGFGWVDDGAERSTLPISTTSIYRPSNGRYQREGPPPQDAYIES